MLFLIGLGLGDAKDITVKGLEVVRRCRRVYLEAYTSVLTVGKEALGYNTQRSCSESNEAGNTLSSHSQCFHNECCRLLRFTDTWRPESFFDKVKKNRQNGMHTLCLLDIKVKEQSLENLIRGRKIYEPPRFMSVNQAAQQLLEIVQNQRIRGEEPAITEKTLCVGLARVGAEDQKIVAGTLQQMCTVDLGRPLHSLIITGGSMHPLEVEMLSLFSISESQNIDGL
ncbi:diphthine methyl ester synthase isoform X2 [Dasypus novemcinctus]|uniref:diphthine methyl ester synthase isoform X2 n=1 Tax=Dasypus novemcinctus TaxID=9361 RepID=UPI0039C967F4